MTAKRGGEGGTESQTLSEELRVRIAEGTYPLRSFLPSQRDLADEFGVSRDTVQRALKELKNEGWIESRQGSGSRVVKNQRIQSPTAVATRMRRGMSLEPLISEAFERPEVTLDVYTLTSETLDAHIRLQAERIRGGFIRPRRIMLRMILPAEDLPLPYPQVKGAPDDPRLRQRLGAITARHSELLRALLRDLQTEGRVADVDVQIRRAPLAPTFKLYLLNGTEALYGPYTVIERQIELDDGSEVTALDVLGFGATLTHHVKDESADSPGTVFVDSQQEWFDSIWRLLADQDGS